MRNQKLDVDSDLYESQLRAVNANIPRLALAGIVVGIIFSVMVYQGNPKALIWHWLILHVLVNVFRIVSSRYIQKTNFFNGPFPKAVIISGCVAAGLIWSSGLLLLGESPTREAAVEVFIVLAGLAAASAVSTAIYLPAFAGFFIPLFVGSTVWLVTHNVVFSPQFSVFSIVFVAGIAAFTSSLHRQFRRHLALSLEKNNLVNRLNGAVNALEENVSRGNARERALRNSESQIRMLIETIPDAVLLVNDKGTIVYCNHASESIFGYCDNALIGRSIDNLVPDRISHKHAKIREAFLSGKGNGMFAAGQTLQVNAQKEDGELFPVQVGVFPTTLDGQHYYAALVRDLSVQYSVDALQKEIVERERAELKLRQVLLDHEMLTTVVQDVMFHLSAEGDFLWTNPAMQKALGKTEQQLQGARFVNFVAIGDTNIFYRAVTKMNSGEEVDFDIRLDTVNGRRYFHFRCLAVEATANNRVRHTGIGRDVEERRGMEEQLRESKRRFELSQAISHVGTWEWNLKNGDWYWSRQIFALAGLPRRSSSARRSKYWARVNRQFRRELVEAFIVCLQEEKKIDLVHKVHLDNGTERWLKIVGDIEFDAEGCPYRVLGALIDIDSAKKAEEEQRQLKMQLLQSQKMESIGLLTGGIAHDFNNMLTSILGFSRLLGMQSQIKSDSQLRNYVTRITEGGERASGLVQQLLSFSREDPQTEDVVDLNREIDVAVKMLKPILPSSILIDTQIPKVDSIVLGSSVKLQQTLMNLCINARDAMQRKGILSIRLTQVEDVQALCGSCFKDFNGTFLELEVSDTGEGIREDLVDRIFDPFLTTKDTGKGTGMGLSMVHGIVHQHGGHIVVNSRPGKTNFKLYFPIAEITHSKNIVDFCVSEEQHYIPANILFVDDDEDITALYVDFLSLVGHSVTTMNDPVEAMKLFQSGRANFDVVITDYTMPRITGAELSRFILEKSPTMPIIMCTGFSEQMNKEAALAMGIKAYLSKPIDNRKLLDTIQLQMLELNNLDPPRIRHGGM